jgi:hypothetical protein
VDIQPEIKFSDQLENWLKSDSKKTVADLGDTFGDKSFALAFILLMFVPALPVPTGGVVHVFGAITILLSLELIAQRKSIWLPKRWRKKELGTKTLGKGLPKLIKIIRKIERISKPRFTSLLSGRIPNTLFGVIVFTYSTFAFFAVPYSGLDTLPSLGVVIISLGVILGDLVIVTIGVGIGAIGSTISIFFGAAVAKFIKGLF